LRILPLLDYGFIRNHPKILAGFSDVTALMSAIQTRCRMVTFHGPMANTLGRADEETLSAFFSALSGEADIRIFPQEKTVIFSGKAKGRLGGGNLTTLCHLIGTPFPPRFDRHIIMMEDWKEPAYKIDRMLTQMKLAGCFDKAAGLILGSFEQSAPLPEIYAIVEDIFKDMLIPVLAGFDMGHAPRNLTVPLGMEAELDTDTGLLIRRKSGGTWNV
jgi:muramoyltetrapeptide carboxypeptidase